MKATGHPTGYLAIHLQWHRLGRVYVDVTSPQVLDVGPVDVLARPVEQSCEHGSDEANGLRCLENHEIEHAIVHATVGDEFDATLHHGVIAGDAGDSVVLEVPAVTLYREVCDVWMHVREGGGEVGGLAHASLVG